MDFNLTNGMIDTHFHGAVMQHKGMDAHGLLLNAVKSGLAGGIDIGLTPSDYFERYALFKDISEISFSAGCYPSEVEKYPVKKSLDELHTLLLQEKTVIAIGEIGLDWHWNYGKRKNQKDLFAGQLSLAKEFNLPVLIHNREADQDIIDILNEVHIPNGGILHCFSSDYSTAKKLLDLGMYISFAGNLTYKNNENIRAIASKIPLDRLFLETDSPYLSPQKQRGKRNHPGHIGYTYEVLGEVKKIPLSEIIQQLNNNFHSLFKIKL